MTILIDAVMEIEFQKRNSKNLQRPRFLCKVQHCLVERFLFRIFVFLSFSFVFFHFLLMIIHLQRVIMIFIQVQFNCLTHGFNYNV